MRSHFLSGREEKRLGRGRARRRALGVAGRGGGSRQGKDMPWKDMAGEGVPPPLLTTAQSMPRTLIAPLGTCLHEFCHLLAAGASQGPVDIGVSWVMCVNSLSCIFLICERGGIL